MELGKTSLLMKIVKPLVFYDSHFYAMPPTLFMFKQTKKKFIIHKKRIKNNEYC